MCVSGGEKNDFLWTMVCAGYSASKRKTFVGSSKQKEEKTPNSNAILWMRKCHCLQQFGESRIELVVRVVYVFSIDFVRSSEAQKAPWTEF